MEISSWNCVRSSSFRSLATSVFFMRDVVALKNTVNSSVRDLQTRGFQEHTCMLLEGGAGVRAELTEELLLMFGLHDSGTARWTDSLSQRPFLGFSQVHPNGIAIDFVVVGDSLDRFS